MKKKFLLAFGGSGILIVGIAILLILVIKPSGGVLLVDAVPASTIYVDGENVGTSPLEKKLVAKDVVVKLVPTEGNFPDYSTKLTLSSGVKTVLRHEFGESEELSAGEEISFEKTGESSSSISVVTIPDSTQILLDGQSKGFSPTKISEVKQGDHVLTLVSQGYVERSFTIKTQSGYRLTAVVKLAKNPDYKKPADDTVLGTDESQKVVEILDTPTGFLRVRSGPGADSPEVAKATPGIKYPLTGQSDDGGWYKIKIEEEEGWISAKYATVSGEISQ